MKIVLKLFLVMALVISYASLSYALDIPLGNKGLNTGVVTPTGFNFIYEAQYYHGVSKDNKGKTSKIDGETIRETTFATDFVAEWHTKAKLLGANYSLDIIVPFVNVDVRAGHDTSVFNASGVADIYIDPLILGWATKWVDTKFIVGFNLPTGSAGLTKDHFSVAVNAAVTAYLNPSKTLTFSVFPTLEFHAENISSDLQEGDDFVVKWGLGYTYGLNTFGIIGYSQVQISDDYGSEKSVKSGEEYVHAAGLQYNRFVPSLNSVLCLLVNQEFSASSRAMGTRVHFTWVKIF